MCGMHCACTFPTAAVSKTVLAVLFACRCRVASQVQLGGVPGVLKLQQYTPVPAVLPSPHDRVV